MTAFAKCASYERAAVEEAVARLWPCVQDFVKPKTRVLVKPNLLRESAPDAAVTTHPEVVRACVKKLLEANADVVVGDSPAFVANLANVWRASGVQAVCGELGVPLISLEQHGCSQREHGGLVFPLSDAALGADLIFNLPKVKTHGLTLLTAAAKNVYGLVPGHAKTQLHKAHPSAKKFGALIRSIPAALPRVVTVADGIVGMEGDGPSSGSPVNLGFLAAGDDAFALDWHLCGVLGLPQPRVSTLDNTPEPPPAQGETICIPPVKRPRASPLALLDRLPPFVAKTVGRLVWFRPEFSDTCACCGKCVGACPARALKLPEPGACGKPRDLPRLDPPRCIGCCCCAEVCPARAVHMRPSPLVRLVGKH